METLLRIIRWLRLLLLSTGMTARSRLLSRFQLCWPSDEPDLYFKKTAFRKKLQTNQLKRLTVKIRIRLLRWLTLQQFPAYPGGQACSLLQYTLFRRIPALLPINDNYKTLKYK